MLPWKVPRLYVDGSIVHDLAWAEIAEDGQHSLQVQLAPVSSTVPSTMFFRQPYDLDAKRDGSQSVVGAMPAILYPSMKSPLLEVLDIGFRGMSGAIAIDTSQLEPVVLGMMSRRAKPVDIKLDLLGKGMLLLVQIIDCSAQRCTLKQIWSEIS